MKHLLTAAISGVDVLVGVENINLGLVPKAAAREGLGPRNSGEVSKIELT